MIRGREFENGEGGVRLDAALLRFAPGSTRAFVREAIEAGRVRVDGRRAAKGLKLRGGEKIEVEELLEAEDNLVRPEPPNGRGGISPNPPNGRGGISPNPSRGVSLFLFSHWATWRARSKVSRNERRRRRSRNEGR